MKKKHKYTQAFDVANLGLYFLNIFFNESSYLHLWVSTSATQSHANMFKYSLKFTQEETGAKYYFVNHVSMQDLLIDSKTDHEIRRWTK